MPVLLNYIIVKMHNVAKYLNNILYELKLDRRPTPTFFFSGYTVDLSRSQGRTTVLRPLKVAPMRPWSDQLRAWSKEYIEYRKQSENLIMLKVNF
jgi:hypothetical protein